MFVSMEIQSSETAILRQNGNLGNANKSNRINISTLTERQKAAKLDFGRLLRFGL